MARITHRCGSNGFARRWTKQLIIARRVARPAIVRSKGRSFGIRDSRISGSKVGHMGLRAFHSSAEHVLSKMKMAVHTVVIRVAHFVGMVQRVVDEAAVVGIAVVLGVKVTRLTGPIIIG
jgi:hypothetical protein